MKLKEGMYIRTKFGISKIIEDGNVKVIKSDGEETYDVDKNGRHYPTQFGDYIWTSDVIKASHSLLGNDKEPCLIEVGDYVNGYKITNICNTPRKHLVTEYRYNINYVHFYIYEENIKTIVTKEQFESMAYHVKE